MSCDFFFLRPKTVLLRIWMLVDVSGPKKTTVAAYLCSPKPWCVNFRENFEISYISFKKLTAGAYTLDSRPMMDSAEDFEKCIRTTNL